MSVVIYKSDDAGAPALLANNAGALIAVLDACLVDGYGAKAGAGWTKAFSDVNLAAYLQGTGGDGMYCRIDDTSGPNARIRGYETMSDVNTGTGPFPTDVQISGGCYVNKHDGGAGSRKWMVVASPYAFYFWSQYDTNSAGSSSGLTFFGTIKSFKAVDDFGCMVMASPSSSKSNNVINSAQDNGGAWCALNNSLLGHFIARAYGQVGGAVPAGKRMESLRTRYQGFNSISTYAKDWISNILTGVFPSPVDGSINIAPVVVNESNAEDRGYLPGLWVPMHAHQSYGSIFDTFDGEGEHAGKTFVFFNVYGAHFALEITDTW